MLSILKSIKSNLVGILQNSWLKRVVVIVFTPKSDAFSVGVTVSTGSSSIESPATSSWSPLRRAKALSMLSSSFLDMENLSGMQSDESVVLAIRCIFPSV